MKHKIKSLLRGLSLAFLFYACAAAPEPASEPVPEEAEILPEIAEEEAPSASALPLPGENDALPVSAFGEIWGYVVAGREAALSAEMPLSDVGYFGAEIDMYGKLTDVPNPRNLRFFKGRIHLVVACNGRALSHFVLREGGAERKALIEDLIAAARNYDGLQIDFELVPRRAAQNFLSFLAELRVGLKGKSLTVALPARTRRISNDVYDYGKIKPLVDRILVMAYDEHWSTSAPGPIASMDWCRNVADYSLQAVGREKLIMGIPFYGRAWGNINPSRAYLYSGIETVMRENFVTNVRRENGIPAFDYEAAVSVKVYYEDDYSLSVRMDMYKAMGVASIGFWRVGQESQGVWNLLRLEKDGESSASLINR
ncbi:MAG: glycoside hydrolase [Treponema sp.]|nr:glycoside hydrolase [Treponema sp.]